MFIYNNLPNKKGIAPADLFTGSTIPRHKLENTHMFGCPVYMLDPVLQAGKYIPRWQPRSCKGMFVGFIPNHSSDVPLILNLQIGSISPQYHLVFDDAFTTVSSVGDDENPPRFWNEINLEACTLRIPLDSNIMVNLQDDWFTTEELEEKSRQKIRTDRVRDSFDPNSPSLVNDFPTDREHTPDFLSVMRSRHQKHLSQVHLLEQLQRRLNHLDRLPRKKNSRLKELQLESVLEKTKDNIPHAT